MTDQELVLFLNNELNNKSKKSKDKNRNTKPS